MGFDTLKNVPQQQRNRVGQQDLLTKAVKLRNSDIYSLTSATVLINDIYGNTAITINQSDTAGKVYFGDTAYVNYIDGNAYFTGSSTMSTLSVTTLNATTITGLYTATELWLAPIIPQWTDSWTINNTYTDVTGSLFDVNFDDLTTGWNVYFDIIGKTDAGTGYWQLYNVDDTAAVANSEISTASTTPINLRSSAITLPTGTKTLKVQHKIVGGNGINEYVNSIMGKLVVRLSA